MGNVPTTLLSQNSEKTLRVFMNSDFGQVRTLLLNGNPYFVGKDVADILGYTNASKALSDHVDSEDKLNNESLLSLGQRGGWIINESGLYSLILSSKLPAAKKFKHWVTSEVLPSIRKSGSYSTPKSFAEALYLAAEQQKQIEAMQPKAKYFDDFADSSSLIEIGHLGKKSGSYISSRKN